MTAHKRNKTCMGTPAPRTFRNLIEEIGEPCANQQLHETFKMAYELTEATRELWEETEKNNNNLCLPKKVWDILNKIDSLETEVKIDLNISWGINEETIEQISYEEHK